MPARITGKKSLAAVIGSVAAASVLIAFVARFEGLETTTYLDPVGVLTVCYGDTDPSMTIPGVTYTPEQCRDRLAERLVDYAVGVKRCTPGVFAVPEIAVPAIDLAYNIGVGAYCKSTAAARFNAERWADGCEALTRYVYARGKRLKGLEIRRGAEFEMCMRGAAKMGEIQ